MPNLRRGEIEAVLDGRPHKLCLTLGALAELEAAFGATDMLALAQRFAGGRLAATDCIRILAAGLRGGGHPLTDDAVASLTTAGGIPGLVAIVAELLTVTFSTPHAAAPTLPAQPQPIPKTEAAEAPRPFPGTT